MHASAFLEKSRDPRQWRKHASALRRSADVLWEDFTEVLLTEVKRAAEASEDPSFLAAEEAFETTKLLYGLAFETALKAWIIEKHPEKFEIRVVLNGSGEATHAELRTVGVSTSSGHNTLALAEAAGLFDGTFAAVIRSPADERALRNICRDLSEVVLWRGRYPVPLASADPLRLDPKADPRAVADYIRDWLDPVLDMLLGQQGPTA